MAIKIIKHGTVTITEKGIHISDWVCDCADVDSSFSEEITRWAIQRLQTSLDEHTGHIPDMCVIIGKT